MKKGIKISKVQKEFQELFFRKQKFYYKELICHGKSCCLRVGNQVYWFPLRFDVIVREHDV